MVCLRIPTKTMFLHPKYFIIVKGREVSDGEGS